MSAHRVSRERDTLIGPVLPMPAILPISTDDASPILLRGTKQGLEVQIQRFDSVEAVTAELRKQFAKAPSFFRGEDVVLRFSGVPVLGSFGPLEAVARDFGLRVIAVRSDIEGSRKHAVPSEADAQDANPGDAKPDEDKLADVARTAAAAAAAARAALLASGQTRPEPAAPVPAPVEPSRMIIGPVRSGVVLESLGDVTIVGDVNPGAEVHAGGSIIVLGALRGIAHAARTEASGFIWAIHLQPQQLRLGNLVARAADADEPTGVSEIAYAKDGHIIVEAYSGRIPRELARTKS